MIAAAPDGPVLELACGTGRVALALAAIDVAVVGLDIDPMMLAVALAGRPAGASWPLFVAGDMRRFAFHDRFAALIVPYNSIQLLTEPSEVADCLACVAAHLSAGGFAGFEVTDFQMNAARSDVAHEAIGAGVLDGHPIRLSGSLHHDLAGRISRYHRRFSGGGWAVEDELAIRSYRRDELDAVLAAAGLVAAQWWEHGPMTRVVAIRPD